MDDLENGVLIAISLKSMEVDPYPMALHYSVVICGESKERDAAFTLPSTITEGEIAEFCRQLGLHGFTVVELPNNWRYVYDNHRGGWKEAVIQIAMKKVANIFESRQGQEPKLGYDASLAGAVLEILDQAFPNVIQLIDVKHRLSEEPTDDALMTALDGLVLEGKADAKIYRGQGRKLFALANIQITSKGREYFPDRAKRPVPSHVIHHGDQYFNLGQAGAMGPSSQGVINSHVETSAIELLANFRAEVTKLVEDQSKRDDILARVAELEAAQDRPSRVETYLKLMGAIGDHITVLGFMLPSILHWVQTTQMLS